MKNKVELGEKSPTIERSPSKSNHLMQSPQRELGIIGIQWYVQFTQLLILVMKEVANNERISMPAIEVSKYKIYPLIQQFHSWV